MEFDSLNTPAREQHPTVIHEIFTWDNLIKFIRRQGIVKMTAEPDGSFTRQDTYRNSYRNSHRNNRLEIQAYGRPLPPTIHQIVSQIVGGNGRTH